jgi:threonine/homoserine/homoserine lactone efflux protein
LGEKKEFDSIIDEIIFESEHWGREMDR